MQRAWCQLPGPSIGGRLLEAPWLVLPLHQKNTTTLHTDLLVPSQLLPTSCIVGNVHARVRTGLGTHRPPVLCHSANVLVIAYQARAPRCLCAQRHAHCPCPKRAPPPPPPARSFYSGSRYTSAVPMHSDTTTRYSVQCFSALVPFVLAPGRCVALVPSASAAPRWPRQVLCLRLAGSQFHVVFLLLTP